MHDVNNCVDHDQPAVVNTVIVYAGITTMDTALLVDLFMALIYGMQ